MPQDIHQAITEAVELAKRAQGHLSVLILTACPLPHDFVQRRDGRPPWCKTCGYATTGERVKMGA